MHLSVNTTQEQMSEYILGDTINILLITYVYVCLHEHECIFNAYGGVCVCVYTLYKYIDFTEIINRSSTSTFP